MTPPLHRFQTAGTVRRSTSATSRLPPDAPITVELVEKCLDRLAVIMMQNREHAPRLLPLFKWLEEEAEALRQRDYEMSKVFARARRLNKKSVE